MSFDEIAYDLLLLIEAFLALLSLYFLAFSKRNYYSLAFKISSSISNVSLSFIDFSIVSEVCSIFFSSSRFSSPSWFFAACPEALLAMSLGYSALSARLRLSSIAESFGGGSITSAGTRLIPLANY